MTANSKRALVEVRDLPRSFGCALGVAAARLLQRSPWVHGKLEAALDFRLLAIGLLIALALGGLGGLYPAWIGSRMSPARALRQ